MNRYRTLNSKPNATMRQAETPVRVKATDY